MRSRESRHIVGNVSRRIMSCLGRAIGDVFFAKYSCSMSPLIVKPYHVFQVFMYNSMQYTYICIVSSFSHPGFFCNITKPSRTCAYGMNSSVANSARSVVPSRTGVWCVWKPDIVRGLPAWPTTSTAYGMNKDAPWGTQRRRIVNSPDRREQSQACSRGSHQA